MHYSAVTIAADVLLCLNLLRPTGYIIYHQVSFFYIVFISNQREYSL